MKFCYTTFLGLRREEIEVRTSAGSKEIVKAPKTEKSRRTLHLTDELVSVLREHKQRQEEYERLLGDLLPIANPYSKMERGMDFDSSPNHFGLIVISPVRGEPNFFKSCLESSPRVGFTLVIEGSDHPMLYTVKEVASLSNVTIKTLHHYHKIGLLVPCEISEAGYRLYGPKELERLQQILFYRELDFPLDKIKELLMSEPDRLSILSQQAELLLARKQRLEQIIQTLKKSIDCMERGESMDHKEMFKGFESEEEWKEALREQNEYLKETYDYDFLEDIQIHVPEMNEQAAEAITFMTEMAKALKTGVKHHDEQVRQLIRSHLDYLNEHGHRVSAADFAAQTRFFLHDDFHLRMLEGQQTGLAYYLCAAAESFAAGSS